MTEPQSESQEAQLSAMLSTLDAEAKKRFNKRYFLFVSSRTV